MTSNHLVIGTPAEKQGFLLTFSDGKTVRAQFGTTREELLEEMSEHALTNWDDEHMGACPDSDTTAMKRYFKARAAAGEWFKIQDLQLN